MERVKFGLTSGASKLFGAIFGVVMPLVFVATAPAQTTNFAVTVRHAPSLNGNGRIEGSLQQLLKTVLDIDMFLLFCCGQKGVKLTKSRTDPFPFQN
jgi:hypothetical protein